MKKLLLSLFLFTASLLSWAQNSTATLKTIKLNPPSDTRNADIMQAFAHRQSTREYSNKEISLQEMSDLLWAANGINRPDSGKRTAPSAMNRQDVKVYVCRKEGTYLYDAGTHSLFPLTGGDYRALDAPVILVLVTDGDETWSALDAGIVSQNISLFCSGASLATVPRATMDRTTLKKALKLTGTQTLMLIHPVGHFK